MQIITNQFQKELKQHGSDSFPFLVSYERLSKYESGSFLWHWHPEIEITYVQKGQIAYRINQNCYHLKEGEMLFGNANVLHSGSMENMQDCTYISITFSPKLVYGFFQNIVRSKYIEPVIQNYDLPAIHFDYSADWHHQFLALVQETIALEQEKPEFYELDVIAKLIAMWKLLLENHSFSDRNTEDDKIGYDRIKEMMLYIEQNYMQKITLADIAAHIHLCESECSRLFKRCMNVSLFSFLQEYRIERSLEYLNNKESISDAAEKSGFSDSNYYSKVFRKVKGCSPREYRKNIK